MRDSSKIRLSWVAPREKARFNYTYDFGHNCEHQVLLEKILLAYAGRQYPVCLREKRACQLEDWGIFR